MCFSFYSVHTPLQSRPDLQAKYEAKRQKLGLEPKFGREEPRDVRLVQEHAVYASMVEAMDAAVGKVLSKLEALGLDKNTLVFFTSDNGGLSTSEGSPTSNLPLRGGKGWLYEGGIREPLIVRWPGVVKPGSEVATPVCSPDYFATLADVTGTQPTAKIDGVSLRPVLEGKGNLPARALFWHYPHYGNQGGAPGAAMRQGDWKLIQWSENEQQPELFNLKNDLGETKNLAAQEPERVKAMLAELHAWQKDVGAVMPTPNPAYDPVKPDGRLPVPANAGKKAAKKKGQ